MKMELSEEEVDLVDLFRRMDRHGKDLVLDFADWCEITSHVVPFPTNREEVTT